MSTRTRSRPLPWLLALALLVAVAPASAGVVTLSPQRDNTLFEDADGDTSNGAGPALFSGVTSQGRIRRALLWFDLAGRLPAGARIDSVTLGLHVSNAPNGIPREFSLHPVRREWGEGTSFSTGGTGAPATANDATWTHAFHPADSWSSPGGDFEPGVSASALVMDVGGYTWSSPQLAADVRSWLGDTRTNHGWLLQGDEAGPGTARRFDSREGLPSTRPVLTIFYTPGALGSPVSWGGLKAIYR
jgi:hypothetical protein